MVAIVVSLTASITAMRRTSTTHDEIALIGSGARGYHFGKWDMAPEHPLIPKYLYGLAVHLSRPNYPAEFDTVATYQYRYDYPRRLLWESGNDGEKLVFRARLVASLFLLALLLTVFFYVRRVFGEPAAAAATVLVAFLPDVLAHAGVAYNDLPIAFGYFLSLIAIDAALRKPAPASGALAGLAVAVAFGIKLSAVAVLPAAVLLFAMEAHKSAREPGWWGRAGVAVGTATIVFVTGLLIINRGDIATLIWSYARLGVQTTVGSGQGAYLFGERSSIGWWYFFPAVFPFKTPVAFQALGMLALVGAVLRLRGPETHGDTRHAPARALVTGLAVFTVTLLMSTLNLGFRYALPALVLFAILVAVGVVRVWSQNRIAMKALITVLMLANVGSVLSVYPFFLSYASEWAPRGRADRVFVDSSLDWGQGLIALRKFQQEHKTGPVYLAFHGSALPAGYGIEYVAWPSSLSLPPNIVAASPRFAVISATLLRGLKVAGDPYAEYRARNPDYILAGSLFVYRVLAKGRN
jgi:hypothetical protein